VISTPRLRRILAATAAVTAGLVFAGPGAQAVQNMPDRAQVTVPQVTKIVVFMVENHSLSEMKAQMPYVYSLATRYAYASDYSAITHPSLPNYLAISGGSTFGVTDDSGPSVHVLHGLSVFGQALANHKTAKLYADSMTSNCQLTNAGEYAVRHNPWTYYVDSRAACRRYDVPVAALRTDAAAGRLPNVSMVIPNLIHDAHDGTLAQSDAWIRGQVRLLMAGPDWRAGRLGIVITADEDDRLHGNKVLTVVASKYQTHRVVTTALNHYSLTRLMEDVLGVRYLRNAATARSMKSAFGIRTLPRP
jgi:acid phosphatase